MIVFKLPTDGETDYIKRVIGMPGETIQVHGGVLHINGVPVERERVGDFAEPLDSRSSLRCERRGADERGRRICLKKPLPRDAAERSHLPDAECKRRLGERE